MKIGILTFFANYNFGANLQAFSTFSYFKKRGHIPIMLNWQPKSFVEEEDIDSRQKIAHESFIADYFTCSKLCLDDNELIEEIVRMGIDAVVIGSDVVLCYHSFVNRIHLSRKKLIDVFRLEPTRGFPTPMWGSFYDKLERKIPIFLMAASSSGANNRFFEKRVKRGMADALQNFSSVYVRDQWTAQMVKRVSRGKIKAKIVPDPVFGFNHNVSSELVDKKILQRFNLPEKYILISFSKKKRFIDSWVDDFDRIARKNGYACVGLAMPTGLSVNLQHEIDVPIGPLEWYSLIKHSSGYVGQNMHPIIVSLHNSVPFFSLDKNKLTVFSLFRNVKASKTYQLLERAGMLDYWHSVANFDEITIDPQSVFDKIKNFRKNDCLSISKNYLSQYLEMMSNIEEIAQRGL